MRKFTLFVASLFCFVGVLHAEALVADGVYTLSADENKQRGELVAAEGYNYPVLDGIDLSGYTDNSTAAKTNGQYWYVKSAGQGDNTYYLYNIAESKYLVNESGNVNFGDTPYVWTFVTNENKPAYLNIKDAAKTDNNKVWLSSGCGRTAAQRPVQWDSNNNDGGALYTFTYVGNYFATPETGKYYKIKGEGEYPWLTANTTEGGNVVVSKNEADAAVFLKTANGLQAIATGKYLGYTGGKYTYSDAEITIELRNCNYGDGTYLANHNNKFGIVSGGNWMFNNNNDGIVHESNQALNLVRLWAFTEVENVVHIAGAGSEDNPYVIDNAEELVLFRTSVNAGETKYSAPGVHVALGADIDLAGENWVGIGSIAQPHGFMGNFDGKNFKIKNLTITDPAADSDGYVYAGLFSVTEGTDKNNQNVIKNLTIENVTINTTGHIVSAAIAYPYCTIVDNVTVCGKIDITGGDYTAGALAYTRRCVNASNVTVAGTEGSTITGASVVGGVISDIQMNGGWIADYSNFSASGVSITGTEMVGGISGIIATQTLNGASVKNVTLASGDSRVGRISGAFGGTSTISNVVVENVTGATAIVGPTYKGANPVEAKVGDTYYSTLAEAVKGAGNVVLLTAVTLKDDVAYASTSSKTVEGEITYTRNLIAGWNPIYLPFATELSTEEYDVATFTSAEGETVTLTKIEDATATLAANTAYVIRPKSEAAKAAKKLTIALTDATLEAATVNTQELGEGFSVKGNYSELTGAKLGANDRVVGTNGNWGVLKSDSKLRPYRLILTIPAGTQAISMRVEGEDATSIENLGITIESDVIYDLMGRRVETMTEGGIYIVNGKKIVF